MKETDAKTLKLNIIADLKNQPIEEQSKTVDLLIEACQAKTLELSALEIREIGMLYNHGQNGLPQDLAIAFKLITFAASTCNDTATRTVQQSVQVLADYNDIVKEFGLITSRETSNEKKLAQLMYNYCHNGRLVSLKELQAINHMVTQDNVNSVNDIFYRCFVKDISTWMLSRESEERVPFATAQSQALWLIKEGHLKIEQVFAKNAPYGIFTSTNTEDAHHKMNRINAVYQKATKEQRTVNFSQPQFAQHRQALSTQEKTKNVFLQQEANPNKITLH